jgi:hypothetical protein
MISLDTLRPALLSANPYAEIDRLVRAELAAGRTTGQIFDDLNPLVDEARAIPGMTEDGEEALFGALDALTGDCHPDCQYKDPPSNTSLTENGLAPPEKRG